MGEKRCLLYILFDLQGEFECSAKVLGPDHDKEKEVRFLGRTIRLTSAGLEWEGDQKHCKAFVDKLNLGELKGVETPGVKSDSKPKVGGFERPLSSADAKLYRGCVALFNFMSQDRVDLSFASKEVSKSMSNPTVGDWAPLKRIAR